MKRSIIADEIVNEWKREKYFKEIAKRKKLECKIDKQMQCDKCNYQDICEDKSSKT